MLRSRLVRTTVVALLAIPLSLFGARGLAIVGPSTKVLFGPIGVGAGQGARVNVYVIGNPNESPWEFAVRIFNRRGSGAGAPIPGRAWCHCLVRSQHRQSRHFPRRSARASDIARRDRRLQSATGSPPGRYTATFEVYSLITGHTSILLGGPDTLPAGRGLVP